MDEATLLKKADKACSLARAICRTINNGWHADEIMGDIEAYLNLKKRQRDGKPQIEQGKAKKQKSQPTGKYKYGHEDLIYLSTLPPTARDKQLKTLWGYGLTHKGHDLYHAIFPALSTLRDEIGWKDPIYLIYDTIGDWFLIAIQTEGALQFLRLTMDGCGRFDSCGGPISREIRHLHEKRIFWYHMGTSESIRFKKYCEDFDHMFWITHGTTRRDFESDSSDSDSEEQDV